MLTALRHLGRPGHLAAVAVVAAAVTAAGVPRVHPTAAGRTADASEPGRPGAEAAALHLASSTSPLPASDDGRACAAERLQVRWDAPAPGTYELGAHLEPVEPPSGEDDEDGNGIVVCRGSSYAYLGFEAVRAVDGRWHAFPVPAAAEEGEGDPTVADAPGEARAAGLATVQPDSPWYGRWGSAIEPLAAYEPQSFCDPVPKAGIAALRALVSRAFPGTGDLGIGRGCGVPGVSEHKEGRAWDWGVDVATPAHDDAANAFISWLLATDEHGNRFAMARRLGVMYVIWDRHIWSAFAADQGWRPYGGPNAHTDHLHLSMTRAAAVGRTSFWRVVPLFGAAGAFPTTFTPRDFRLGSTPPPRELGPRAGETSPTAASPQPSGPAASGAGSPTTTAPPAPAPAPAPAPVAPLPTPLTLPPAPAPPPTTVPLPLPTTTTLPPLPVPVPTTLALPSL